MFKQDERYLCAYLCNKNLIHKAVTLLNFYNEIARISLKTKDNTFMQIRLKWFIEAILNLYNNNKSGFPIIDNLLPIIKEYNIDQKYFIEIINARTIDKDYVPFKNISEYITYCENTGGYFWQIITSMYTNNSKLHQKAGFITGTVFAVIGNIRNVNFDTKRMNYKLVFDKKIVLKGEKEILSEMKKNIIELINYSNNCIKQLKDIKLNKKYKKLFLLNVFSKGYSANIKNNIDNIKNLDPYNFPLIYKIIFIIKTIFNT